MTQKVSKNRIFQKLADSMSSGMQNAQNFAPVVSSMVLEHLFFSIFCVFLFESQGFSLIQGAFGNVGPKWGFSSYFFRGFWPWRVPHNFLGVWGARPPTNNEDG